MASSSPFLNLPGELRNEVYEYVSAADLHMNISSSGDVRGQPLAGTCKQIRSEFLSLYADEVQKRATDVNAVVRNLDFTRLQKQLDRIIGAVSREEKLVLNLTLMFGEEPDADEEMTGFSEWLKWCASDAARKIRIGTCEVAECSADREYDRDLTRQYVSFAHLELAERMYRGAVGEKRVEAGGPALASCRLVAHALDRATWPEETKAWEARACRKEGYRSERMEVRTELEVEKGNLYAMEELREIVTISYQWSRKYELILPEYLVDRMMFCNDS